MVKAKRSNKRKKKVTNNSSRQPSRRSQRVSAHTRLLGNPCEAPLALPNYEDTGSGLLVRLKQTWTVFNGAGHTGGVLHWTPGLGSVLTFSAPTSTGALPLGPTNDAFYLSGQYLSNVQTWRTVAACMRVYSTQNDQTRSGRLALGNSRFRNFTAGANYNVDSVLGVLGGAVPVERSAVEVVWTPCEADSEFTKGPDTDPPNKSSLTLAAAGLPAGTGLMVEFWEVVEYIPAVSAGIVTSANRGPPKQTLAEMLREFWAVNGSTVRSVGVSALKHMGTMAVSALL